MTDHPITPPPELLKQWEDDWFEEREHADVLLIRAFQAGADQELEACVRYLDTRAFSPTVLNDLRATRRPKPPSLKELALEDLEILIADLATNHGMGFKATNIRRALEVLPDD